MGEDDYEDLLLDDQEEEEDRVVEWEAGLPGPDELTPLSQPLVPPGLAAAFRIHPEPGRTLLDVHRAAAETLASLTSSSSSSSSSFRLQLIQQQAEEEKKKKEEEDESNKPKKKGGGGRLVWTPQLHKRFVDVVAHLGMKKAVPKSIMELMNVEGLTRENVASHLQKYRLYVKRIMHQGDDDDDDGHGRSSSPDHHQVHQQQLVPAPPASHPYAAMYPIPNMVGINSSSSYYYQHQHQHQQMSGYQYHYANK